MWLQFFLEFISQLSGAGLGVIAGYAYIEIRTKAQQKPRQELIEKHKKNIKQLMLFYMPHEIPGLKQPKILRDL